MFPSAFTAVTGLLRTDKVRESWELFVFVPELRLAPLPSNIYYSECFFSCKGAVLIGWFLRVGGSRVRMCGLTFDQHTGDLSQHVCDQTGLISRM